jgi:hypothetical protein
LIWRGEVSLRVTRHGACGLPMWLN